MGKRLPKDLAMIALAAVSVGACLGFFAAQGQAPRMDKLVNGPPHPLKPFKLDPLPEPPTPPGNPSFLVGSFAVETPADRARDAAYWLTECARLRGTDKAVAAMLKAAKGWHRTAPKRGGKR